MKRYFFTFALTASLFPALGGCHAYYFAHARVPLSAPADTSCLRTTLVDDRPFGSLGSHQIAEGRSTAVAYSTPAMFHDRWETVTQVIRRDSSIYRGEIFRDSSATLGATFVQLDRRIDPRQAKSTTEHMAQFLLDLRDACGGRSPGGEQLFSTQVSEAPYRAWAVRGTDGGVVMRLTVDSLRYWWHFRRNAGRYVLRVDTLAADSEPRFPQWSQADSLRLSSPQNGTTLATDCWRGDSLPSGDLVALTRETDTPYFTEVLDAWALDRAALRIRPISVAGVECRNTDWGSMLPDAPHKLRTAALTFRPSPGMARIYAYLSDLPTERAIARVAVDSQVVGWVGGGSFLMVEVEPGRHRVSAPAGRHESALWLDAAPDSAYFVELRKNRLAWTLASQWRAKVRKMDAGEARDAIRWAQMVPSSWPGTPMR